jgi:DNA-damage-inducible protein J
MAEEATISATIDSDLKRRAERIFSELGLTPAQAIQLFYQQVSIEQDLPFRVPNKATRMALEDARRRRNLVSFASVDDLFDDLEIETP